MIDFLIQADTIEVSVLESGIVLKASGKTDGETLATIHSAFFSWSTPINTIDRLIQADMIEVGASESGTVLKASGKTDQETLATVHSTFNFSGVTLSGPTLMAQVIFEQIWLRVVHRSFCPDQLIEQSNSMKRMFRADTIKVSASGSSTMLKASGKTDQETLATVYSAFDFLEAMLSDPTLMAWVVFEQITLRVTPASFCPDQLIERSGSIKQKFG